MDVSASITSNDAMILHEEILATIAYAIIPNEALQNGNVYY